MRVALSNPPSSLAQRSDVSDMVTPVPGIKPYVLIQAHSAKLRVLERARKIVIRERAKQHHPSVVERFSQRERGFKGRALRIVKLSPSVFLIRLDSRLIFGQSQLEAYITVKVAVGQVMNYLPDGPSPIAVRRIDLFRR